MPMLRASALLLSTFLVLSGCQSSEEKAEGYFQSGLTLLAAGDEERALVEFRNVFKYDGFHKDARKTYADILVKRGDLREAYGQYLRLIEQYPDTVEVRQTLAEMALAQGNFDETERHGRAALQLAPDAPDVQAIGLALDYRAAVLARDVGAEADIARKAEALQAGLPQNLVLRRILIDNRMRGPEPQTALAQIDAALEIEPESFEFHSMRLSLLGQAEDVAGFGQQLKTMVALFPENEELKASMIRWLMVQGDTAGAEAFLRDQAGDLTADPKGHLEVVYLLSTTKGREAAQAELEQLIAANAGTANADLYGAFLATMTFEDGQNDQAIAQLGAILETAAPSDQTRKLMTMQAQMLDRTGARDKAEVLVEKILTEDASNVDALKLRAAWHIAADRAGLAIQDLRTAQGQAPRDPQIMTLMAAAYERDGNRDLAAEQLAKAFEVSRAAPDESLRYASFLLQQGRPQVAETVLTDARRASPAHVGVLQALAEVLLENAKWPQAREVADTLRQLGTPETLAAAERIQAATLFGQDRMDEGLALLEAQAAASSDDVRPSVTVVMIQIRAGRTNEARSFLDEALKKAPNDPTLRVLSANVDALLGKTTEAEAAYRALISDDPTADLPVRMLYGLLVSESRDADARAVLDAGLEAQPDNESLLWTRAGLLERDGRFDETIAIYEKLYERNSSNIVAANNLASMITSYRDDPESLERAYAIARRLRDSPVPAFQDTYGWIEYRRGNPDVALKYLEPAAKGLPDDPLAQFHLGMAYADLGRKDEAIAQLRRALELGAGRDLPQLRQAEEKLGALTAAP
ncbi:MAG: tetratricopeptide repeat protein [Pseudotabrizicola sp.]|uniref:tetratricopeptide repeat protein n=1 Tax=Pseudotabrizicola sp. TaxID=2939647 RepID=UPI00271FDD59|nr:tetratricopeptide repeat protein [Pseudotabrizicola sp.]MDO9640861.1 tetratricopeptide repeat protein [Pseudotabrizicola sp.]